MVSRNYKVLVTRRFFSSFFNGMSQQYIDLYIVKLGASVFDLGILRSFSSFLSGFVSSSLGFAADIWGRKRAYMVGMLFEALSALFFALAFDWKFAMIGLVLGMVAFYGLGSVENILIADSIKSKRRAFGFGVAWSLSTLASSFSPMVAAIIINEFGGLTTKGIRPIYYIQSIGLIFSAVFASLLIREVFNHNIGQNYRGIIVESFEMLKNRKWLQRWIIVEILGGYVFSSTIPFQMIYAVNYKHADEFVIGYMGTAFNFAAIASSPLVGKMGDKYGRVKTLIMFRPLFYISMIIFLLAPSPLYLIVAWAIRGIFFASASVFQTLVMELVPKDLRGRWLGIKNLISVIVRSPAPMLGGYLYYSTFPEAPFILAILIDIFMRVPLIYSMPETLCKERYIRYFNFENK